MSNNQINTYNRIYKLMKDIEGYLSFQEAVFLYNTAKNVKNGVIVEIGAYKGLSTICLGLGSKEGNKVRVFSIDPHKWDNTKEDFLKNIKKYEVDDIIVPVYKESFKFIEEFEEPIGFLFIDGDHRYLSCEKDFVLYFPKIIVGGIVAIHDATRFFGPKEVAIKYICKSKLFETVGIVDSIVYGNKSIRGKLHNKIKNSIQYQYWINKRKNSPLLLAPIIKLDYKTIVANNYNFVVEIDSIEETILKYFNGKYTFYEIVEKTGIDYPVIKKLFYKLYENNLATFAYEWNKLRYCESCKKYILSSKTNQCPLCSHKLIYVPISSPYDPRPLTLNEKLILIENINEFHEIKNFEERFVLSNTIYNSKDNTYTWELTIDGLLIGNIHLNISGSNDDKQIRFYPIKQNFEIVKHNKFIEKYLNFKDLEKFVYPYDLSTLIKESKDFIIEAYKNYGGNQPILILFSGGKESVVLLDIALTIEELRKKVIFVDIGVEHPFTVRFIKTIEQHFNIDVIKMHGNFWRLFNKKGHPTLNNRWCADYKYELIKEACHEMYDNKKPFLILEGSRAYEEDVRRNYWRIHKDARLPENATVAHPLKYWTCLDIWLYILKKRLPVNPLYKLGWERSVCWLCPGQSVIQAELVKRYEGDANDKKIK